MGIHKAVTDLQIKCKNTSFLHLSFNPVPVVDLCLFREHQRHNPHILNLTSETTEFGEQLNLHLVKRRKEIDGRH